MKNLNEIVSVILATFIILIIVIFLMGGGHGTYLPAKLIFPYAMIIALINNKIGVFAIILAIVQIPIYSILIKKSLRWKFLILVVHIVIAIICLYMPTEAFV